MPSRQRGMSAGDGRPSRSADHMYKLVGVYVEEITPDEAAIRIDNVLAGFAHANGIHYDDKVRAAAARNRSTVAGMYSPLSTSLNPVISPANFWKASHRGIGAPSPAPSE